MSYRATQTPSDLAGSGWYELLPAPPPAVELRGVETADWVIIGAGFAGLAAAQRLRQLRPGERIVVVEAQRIGWGSAGRNSGFMIDLPHALTGGGYAGAREADRRQIAANRRAIRFAQAMADEFGLREVFDLCGKYHGAAEPDSLADLRRFQQHLEALGEPYTALDAGAMREVTGTDFYLGGMHAPGCAMLQPAAFVRGVGEGLKPHVDLFESSPVTRIDPGPVVTVHTALGRVGAPRVILTVNGQADSFGLFRDRLFHLYLYASLTRELTPAEQRRLGGHEQWALVPAHTFGSTVRRIAPARLLIRNSVSYAPELANSATHVERMARYHDRSFAARFPMLGEVEMQYRWSGLVCLSRNGAGAFGQVDEGIYSACCQNGLGAARGTLSGLLIAEHAAGESNAMIEQLLTPPARLPPHPVMGLAARARIAWGQWRAGADR